MFPQTFIDKTLELIIDRGPMPFHAPGGRQQEAHPLTNSHRDVLRMLQKQGAVKIEYEGDELMVSDSGPPVPDKMFAALRSLPDRAIYVVPTEQRRQMARLSLVVSQRLAGDDRRIMIALMPGARREVAEGEFFLTAEGEKFMPRLMAFNRPIFMDHRCIKSAASTLALRTYMDGLPAAYGERSIEPTIRPDRWKYGDPARFHRPPVARPVSREEYMMARLMDRARPRPIYPPDDGATW